MVAIRTQVPRMLCNVWGSGEGGCREALSVPAAGLCILSETMKRAQTALPRKAVD